MKVVTRHVDVRGTPEQVFAYVGDLERYPEFWVGLTQWEPEGDSVRHVGDRFAVTLKVGATNSGGLVRLTELDPPHRMAWTSEVGTRHDASFDVAANGRGSRVALTLRFRLAGGTSGRLVEHLAEPIVSRLLEATLETLRHRVEWGHLDAVATGS